MTKQLKWFLPVLTGVFMLLIWYGAKSHFEIRDFILPSPTQILNAAISERATLWEAALTTMEGAVLGFLAAGTIGFLMAMVMGLAPGFRRSLYPYILVLQMTPVIVFAPVLVIWLGPGIKSVSVITFLICFFPVVANTTKGLISFDRNMTDLFRMLNASRPQEVLLLRVPYALPYYLTGLRIAGSLAMIGAIVGDLYAGNSAGGTGGLGYMVILYNYQL